MSVNEISFVFTAAEPSLGLYRERSEVTRNVERRTKERRL